MTRLRLVLPLFAFGLLSSGFLMGEDKKAEKEPVIVKAQLPRYFKQLGLSDKQKKEIYLIQAKYAVEIKKLNEQIDALKEKSKADVENILTNAQKSRLKELRSGTDK
jgi:hypothetical protein